jgi:hypothetical protein
MTFCCCQKRPLLATTAESTRITRDISRLSAREILLCYSFAGGISFYKQQEYYYLYQEYKMKGLFGRKGSKDVKKKDAAAGGSSTKPGAKGVAGGTTVFRVLVPEGVKPGEEFQVYAGSRIVKVRCPPDSKPGQSLQITVPIDPDAKKPALPDSKNVKKIEGSAAYMVTIPETVAGGQSFQVVIAGQQLMVTCPPNARPGMAVRITPPAGPTDITQNPAGDAAMGAGGKPKAPANKDDATQLFEVQVPNGVKPGAPFALLAGGVRVLVTCPPNASAGQRIRFKLPLALTQKPIITNEAALVKLKYDKDGWTRTVRITDMKFQWIRMDDLGGVDTNTRFHVENSAYVRKLDFRAGDDPRIRTAVLSLVPASEAVVDSNIKAADGTNLVSYSDIAQAQVKNFDDKADWFQQTCAHLCVEWNEGHMRMNVRRAFLLGDSVDAVMSLSRKDLRKLWRFEFIGEAGIDAGGLAREWFQLVTEEIFDPDMGLWQSSAVNQMCMQVNPASGAYYSIIIIIIILWFLGWTRRVSVETHLPSFLLFVPF